MISFCFLHKLLINFTIILVKADCTNDTDCYVVKTSKAKWQEARSRCQADGLRLSKISSPIENNAVKTLLKGVTQAWIGLERQNNFCFKTPISYQNWDFHEPNDKGLVENCVAIGSQGKWSDEDCNASLAIICKRGMILMLMHLSLRLCRGVDAGTMKW
jgi:hypothetical protein